MGMAITGAIQAQIRRMSSLPYMRTGAKKVTIAESDPHAMAIAPIKALCSWAWFICALKKFVVCCSVRPSAHVGVRVEQAVRLGSVGAVLNPHFVDGFSQGVCLGHN